MWWSWKLEKSITGVPVVRAKINRFAMALTVELNSSRCFSMRKNLAQPTFAAASIQKIHHSATVHTETSDRSVSF